MAGRTASTFGTGHRVFLASSVQRDAFVSGGKPEVPRS
jgi:hypothetical protein